MFFPKKQQKGVGRRWPLASAGGGSQDAKSPWHNQPTSLACQTAAPQSNRIPPYSWRLTAHSFQRLWSLLMDDGHSISCRRYHTHQEISWNQRHSGETASSLSRKRRLAIPFFETNERTVRKRHSTGRSNRGLRSQPTAGFRARSP